MTNLKKGIQFVSAISLIWILSLSNATAAPIMQTDYEKNWTRNLIRDLKSDSTNYFQKDNLIFLGESFLISGVLANTGLDRAFRGHWQTDIKSSATDNFFAIPKLIGGLSYFYAPIYLGTMGIGHIREHTPIGNVVYHWGYRSLRTFIVGGAQQVFLTNLLGSGRPNRNEDSKWQPFKYQTGVSGHSFYGAIPLLTAAMMTDPPGLRYTLFFLSTLPGLSRIDSDRHYLSQVIMGWALAYLSARSVYQSDSEREPAFQTSVVPKSDGAMLAARLKF